MQETTRTAARRTGPCTAQKIIGVSRMRHGGVELVEQPVTQLGERASYQATASEISCSAAGRTSMR